MLSRSAAVAALPVLVLVALGGCDDGGSGGETGEEPGATATTAYPELPDGCPTPADPGPHEYDEQLHDELMAMFERDQSGRTGGPDDEGDPARTERLREVLAERGWPGFDLVGEDGEDAAWTIAQHADLDPDLQRCALALLEIAVDAGQGSPGNLAYLSDRVAVGAGEKQRYGTQVGCGDDGTPRPATPLEEPGRVDELREEAGLPPYEEYLTEMEQLCSEPVS